MYRYVQHPQELPSYNTLFGPEGSEWQDINHSADIGTDVDGFNPEDIETISRDLFTLPEDVVSQIFVYACRATMDSTHDVNPIWRRPFCPLWLGKICRAWRNCAWASSELWTTIIIRIATRNIDTQIELLQEWIERAKGRPLDIYIGEMAHPSTGLLSLLSKHSEQWQRVNFCLHPRRYRFFSNGPLPLPLPLLLDASLPHSDDFMSQDQHSKLDLSNAPLLRTLSLSHSSFGPNISSFYPTKQITRLTLSSSHNIDLKFLLDQFRNLRVFTSANCGFSQGTNLPITHDRLQSLNVKCNLPPHYLDSFFLQLSLPTLSSLSISTDQPFKYTNALPQFFEHSWCALTQLTIECHITAEYDLIDLLSLSAISTSLTELHIRHYGYGIREVHFAGDDARMGLSRTFFDNLHPDDDPNYLPCLEILEYEGPLVVQAIDFLEPLIVRSRMRAGSNSGSLEGIAVLRKATIKADQYSKIAEFSIAEYSDPQYVWEVIMIMEAGVLELLNRDGSMWH